MPIIPTFDPVVLERRSGLVCEAPRPEGTIIMVDVETTSLDERRGRVLELALMAVTADLTRIVDTLQIVLPLPPWDQMPEDLVNMHRASGLLDDVEALAWHPDATDRAAQEAALFVRRNAPGRLPPMTGNSVHFDRRWLRIHLPFLHDAFSHRNIDVSSLRELWAAWGLAPFPKPPVAHRALTDLMHALDELRYYQNTIIR